ncbi:MAG: thioesterase family protein [Eggerthellales bacterium]|nr:thioesterase family protein [Eggerthellales bacterium]
MPVQICTPITVRYAETDMMGVVYHANYLLYFEDARTDFLKKVGLPYEEVEELGFMCPIYSASLSYGQPLRYGEDAFVATQITQVSSVKVTYHQEVYRQGMEPGKDKPLVSGDIVCCMVRKEDFAPVSFKRELPEHYELYLKLIEGE